MLQNIREHVQGVVAIIVIVLVGISFVFFGVSSYFESGGSGREVIAKVGSIKIYQPQFDNQLKNSQQQLSKLYPESSMLQKKQIVLQKMIEESVTSQALHNSWFRVSPFQLQAVIASEPFLQENGHFSKERFMQFLQMTNMNEQDFLKSISTQVSVTQLQQGIEGSSFLLPAELSLNYELLNQTRNVGYFQLSAKSLENKVKPKNDEVDGYYSSHSKDFETKEKVAVDYIVLSPKLNLSSVSDEDVSRYYKDNIANYTVPTKWKILTLSATLGGGEAGLRQANKEITQWQSALAKGTPFSDLIEKAGQSTKSRWVIQQDLPAAQANALSTLAVKRVSAPVKTNNAITLIKLLAFNKATTKPLSAVSKQIKQMLAQQKAQKIFSDQSNTLNNLVYTNPDSLQPAAKKLGLTVQKSTLFNRSGLSDGIFSDPKVVAAAFSDVVLKQDNNSDPVSLADGRLVVLRVAKHVASRELALTEVRAKIEIILKKQLAEKELQKQAESIVKDLNSGESAQVVAKKYRLVWQTKDNVSRSERALDPMLVAVAYHDASGYKDGNYHAVSTKLVGGDMAVVSVLKINYPSFSKASLTQQESTTAQMEQYLGQLDLSLYFKAMTKKVKVKVYDKSLQSAWK